MTEHAGHRLDVYTVLQGDGGEGVAEIVESDLREARSYRRNGGACNVVFNVFGDKDRQIYEQHLIKR